MAKKPWARPADEVAAGLEVEPGQGLSDRAARRRLREHGPNALRRVERTGAWEILLRQFKSVIIALLAAATAVSFAFGHVLEGIAIAVVIVINTLLGFVTELRAVRSMEALRRLGQVKSRVRRGGRVQEVPAREVVPGDVVLLEGGDLVTADLRLVEVSRLQADESALTGESVPVDKQLEPADEDAELAGRASMVFKGTAVTRGSGAGVAVATGMDTELGRVSELVAEAEDEQTPIEKRLNGLARRLVWVVLIIGALVAAGGIIAGRELFLMVETGLALAVAAIPQGLPVVATIALARGMWRMARRNALINRLNSVETLGATNLILADKTGTLTENRMTVAALLLEPGRVEVDDGFRRDGQELDPDEDRVLRVALETGVLCNNAALGDDGGVGDPMEAALLAAGDRAGIGRDELLERKPEEREEAFDPETRMMATFHRDDDGLVVAVKGAGDAVLEKCGRVLTADGERELDDEARERWRERDRELAADGMRVLALATRRADSTDEEPYRDLVFIGLAGMRDPPRADVPGALDECRDAGIRVVMATGDQPETARSIGVELGLFDEDAEVLSGRDVGDLEDVDDERRERVLGAAAFARVSPAQKLGIIRLHQEAGAVVAMTGDGVNDAPGLKQADIGVAMGGRGTQVAREAADMVLEDDAFPTIVAAVRQGRVIFGNIRRFVVFLLSCNVSEVVAVSLASFARAPLPVLPLQILFINLVTDSFTALALGVGRGDPAVMERPPRPPGEPVLTRGHWLAVAGYGLLITAAVLTSLWLAYYRLGMSEARAVTVSFLVLAFGQVLHVFNMRGPRSGLFVNDVTRNPWVWGAVALCSGLLLAAVYLPPLARVLRLVEPGLSGWLIVAGLSIAPVVLGQALRRPGRWLARRLGVVS